MISRNAALAAVVLLVTISGCSGATGGLQIEADHAETTALGNVVVTATVENTAEETREGTLYCEVSVSGRIYEDSYSISVDGESRETYEMKFDVPISDYGDGGEYSCELK
ncbi:hypothetical protein VB773_14905 [Haloarculaceae archaeon H-GB2-1]|nr:hypothetical protein [Haloarculaceae archaeon H-GB1-1]MEA5408724.1 hypothetical protein [Haloarculaceae archaeon H-GB2-1]